MDLSAEGHLANDPLVVDLRRYDERTLYGSIPGQRLFELTLTGLTSSAF